MSVILGINAYHGDSSAALVRDGRLVAAVEEERFRRIKHWAGLPIEAIRYCLREAGMEMRDLEHVAINLNPRVNNVRRALYLLTRRPDLQLILNRLKKRTQTRSLEDSLRAAFPGGAMRAKVHYVEHHLAHLASSYLCSPFPDAVNVSVDGFGDFASVAWGRGRGQDLRVEGRVYFPHSLGIFYSALTQYLGFPHFGDEYKVMGLAPYGQPLFLQQLRQVVRCQPDGGFELELKYFRHHRENVHYTWNDCSPEVGPLFTPALEQLLGPARSGSDPLLQRHKDLARSIQGMYEEAFFNLLNALHKKYGGERLTLSGGCAMNSVANGKVQIETPFRRVYIQSAAGDAGGAIGAALIVAQKFPVAPVATQTTGGEPAMVGRFRMDHAYWGPAYADTEIAALLRARGFSVPNVAAENLAPSTARAETAATVPASSVGALVDPTDFQLTDFRSCPDDLCRETARAISEGLVVGWFQGRLEWGPRALGNRSIVCDPRRADMKDILNQKIKRRESFRPFAPSILREQVGEWFETDADVPFMMQVFQFRAEKRPLLPAVCHVDGSGRLQTVDRASNPLYYDLINAFREITGVPMVLNTSFNENEPVVCRPEEALDCFLRTKMDLLVLGSFLIRRRSR